jgi:phosphohistidine phosphatase
MRRLFIFRHAKSSWKDPELGDFDRPLNKRGRKAAPEMGRRLKKRKAKPDLIVTSPAARAVATAGAVAEQLGYPGERIVEDERIYGAGIDTLLEVVRGTDDGIDTLMIFGHNPGFTDLARSLTGEYIANLPTCAVYCVDFDLDAWGDVGRGTGRCAFYDFPKKTG